MSDSKVSASAKRKQPPGGSRKGIPNRSTALVKDMILGALEAKGGQEYLEEQATKNPTAFLALVGKILPKDVNASLDVKGQVKIISEFPND